MIMWEVVLCEATSKGYECKVKSTHTEFKQALNKALMLADSICLTKPFLCFYFKDVIDSSSPPDIAIVASAINAFYVAVRRKEVVM